MCLLKKDRVFGISWGIAKWWGGSCTRPVEGDHKGRPYISCQPHEILKSQKSMRRRKGFEI